MCLVEILPKPGTRPMMLDILEWDAKAGDYRPVQKPKLQPACYMAAAEGMEVLGDTSEHVVKARKRRAGVPAPEPPGRLPDLRPGRRVQAAGLLARARADQKRMRDEPVHKPKGVVFGPTIVYDAERCVMCTRCIRFMAEVAKDPVLDMRERGNLNEIIVAPGPPARRALHVHDRARLPGRRAHDEGLPLQGARLVPAHARTSVCQGCATGCNAYLDYDPRYNKAYRYRPRDNEEVNKYWMCDEGMLTYKAAHEGRVLEAKVRGAATSNAKALDEVKKLFEGVPKEAIGVVLSAQHSLEDNWALRELARVLIGTPHIFETRQARRLRGRHPHPPRQEPEHRGRRAARARRQAACRRSSTTWRPAAITHVIALGGAVPVDAEALGAGQGRDDRRRTTGPLTELATVVLPATSWAEQSGTYVNAKGMRQVSEKALEPQGVSKPGVAARCPTSRRRSATRRRGRS